MCDYVAAAGAQELKDKVDQLLATQDAYRNILRLALSFNDHLYGIVQAQRQLSQGFGELAAHQPELHKEFAKNHASQKVEPASPARRRHASDPPPPATRSSGLWGGAFFGFFGDADDFPLASPL